MTKEDVLNAISERTQVDKKLVTTVVEDFFVVVKKSMETGRDVHFRGFGSFINQKRAKKIGRNISQNTPIVIEEHFIPKFRPAEIFSEMVKNSNTNRKRLQA